MPSLQPIWVENPEEEPKTTLYGRITNSDTPPLYDDIMNSDLSKEDKVKQIQYRTKAYQDDLDRQLNKDLARMNAGTALSAASFHPFFNVPYVGTGIGGAMYDLGQGIVEGDTAGNLAKRAGRGFVIGETIGAIPYIGKALGKTKAGQAVINSAPVQAVGNVLNKAGEKFANSKLYDALMTDIIPNSNKQPVYYHGTKAVFDDFLPEFIGTAHDPGIYGKGFYFTPSKNLAQSYAQSARNGKTPRVIAANLEMKNPLNMTDFNSAEDIAKYLNMEENIGDFIPAEYGNKTIYRPNGFLQNTGKFQSRVMDLGHDGVIVGNNEVVVFNPNQIKQIENPNLYNYLKNDSILTKGYRENKAKIDNKMSNLYDSLSQTTKKDILNGFEKFRANPDLAELKLTNVRNDLKEISGSNDIYLLRGNKKGGVEHIFNDHPEDIEIVANTLKNGGITKVVPGRKVFIESTNGECLVSLDYNGKKKNWLLTGYEKKKKR